MPDLQKEELLRYCLSHYSLSTYFPDELNVDSISRKYIIQVIWALDKVKFKQLEDLVKSLNDIKEMNQESSIPMSLEFMKHLNEFKSYYPSKEKGRIYSYKQCGIENEILENKNLSKEEKKKLKKVFIRSELEKKMGNHN